MELVNRTAFTSVSASSRAHTPSFSEYSHPCNVLVRKVNGLPKKLNLIAKNMSQLSEGCIESILLISQKFEFCCQQYAVIPHAVLHLVPNVVALEAERPAHVVTHLHECAGLSDGLWGLMR